MLSGDDRVRRARDDERSLLALLDALPTRERRLSKSAPAKWMVTI